MNARIAIFSTLLGLAVAAQAGTAPDAHTTAVWQRFAVDIPSGYCVQAQLGPDFVVHYLRAGDLGAPILAGIYTGHAPSFTPDCASPSKRSFAQNGLRFESVQGADQCGEFLVSDPQDAARGFLHLWFGPDAKRHPDLAKKVVDSIAPASGDAPSQEPPACK